MSSITTAILRRPDGLAAQVSRRKEPFATPRYHTDACPDPYVEDIRPLVDVEDLNRDHLMSLSRAWERLSHVRHFNRQTIEDLSIEQVRVDNYLDADRGWLAMHLWVACGNLPGLAGLLGKRPWEGLDAETAYQFLEPLLDCQWRENPACPGAWFETLLEHVDDYFQQIKQLPPAYQLKGIQIFRDAVFECPGATVGEVVHKTLGLLRTVCREPLAIDSTPDVYAALLHLEPPYDELWLACDLKSFRAMERATRRSNDAGLIARGLLTLAKEQSAWLVTALQRCPTVLLRAAKTLGCMSRAMRLETLIQWREHPLYGCDDVNWDLRTLAQYIHEHRPADVYNPLSRKVRMFVGGEWQLTDLQIQRALDKIRDQLFDTRTDLLRQLALERLARSVGSTSSLADDAAVAHAVHLQRLAEENRRGLRTFLRAYFAGQHDYLDVHPANWRWLACHPAVDAARWRAGLTLQKAFADQSPLTLAIETNPLEVLRLGTYVGSCLGLGGAFAASAAAVVLDVNKAVVYARDQRGHVVARQLLAVSEDDKLVCFEVYPSGTSTDMQQCFLDFDKMFADDLNIALHFPKPTRDEPAIANPLSIYWWDDGAWNLKIEDESP